MKRYPTFDPSDIFAALNRAKVRYLVVGGVAVVAYGVPRTTYDVDIIVEFSRVNLQRLGEAMRSIGFMPRLPVGPEGLANVAQRRRWINQKGMQVYAFMEQRPPFRIVDIMVKHVGNFRHLYGKRTHAVLNKVRIPLVPRDHLLRMKRIAGRPQDLEDIRDLTWLVKEEGRIYGR